MFVDDIVGMIHFAKEGLFDLARGVARHLREDDAAGALVAGELLAELVDVFLRAGDARGRFHDGAGDLAEARVGKPDDGDVLDERALAQEVLDLESFFRSTR